MESFISSIIYLEAVAFSVLLLGALYLFLHSKYPNTYIGYAGKNAKQSAAGWETANRVYGVSAIVNSLAVGGLIAVLSALDLLGGVLSAFILTELIFMPVLLADFFSGRAHKKYELNMVEES